MSRLVLLQGAQLSMTLGPMLTGADLRAPGSYKGLPMTTGSQVFGVDLGFLSGSREFQASWDGETVPAP